MELRVQVTAFHFQDSVLSQNAPQPVLDSSTGLDDILAALSGDVTYTGCGRCSSELDTDANGIYGPCYPCLPHTAVRRYYRCNPQDGCCVQFLFLNTTFTKKTKIQTKLYVWDIYRTNYYYLCYIIK